MALRRAGVFVAVVVAASVGGWRLGAARPSEVTKVRVVGVIDGDTIEVARPGARTERVRLLGVDTPEIEHPDAPPGSRGADECFGPEAATFTREELAGREVALRFDVVRRDRYGRLLALVESGGERFNDRLLREGYARLLVIAPNGRHARAMLDAELDARHAGRGLWGPQGC